MHYFVTGASGFIGKRLVRKLLAAKDNVVWFLMREESRDKLAQTLAFWGETASNAIPVFGDIRAGNLGIAETELSHLSGKVDHFFHLAAIYDLKAAAGAQSDSNIGGTRHAVSLANRLQAGCFHHMSSIAAAGLYDGTFREDMFEEAEHIDHPYFSTKHEAEKIVREECAIPWRIYRPGLVIGDSATGEADKIDGPYYFFKLIQRIRGLLPPWMPVIGIEGGRINIVPVDYVVNAITAIAHHPGQDGKCFHLTDPHPMRVGDILDLFARSAHAPRLSLRVNAALLAFIPEAVRKGVLSIKPIKRLRDGIMRKLDLPGGVMHFANYPTRFDNRQAAAILKEYDLVCPRLEDYADRIWDYWERHLDPELHIDRSLRGNVEGKVVLVTGGSSGIGLATAHKIAAAGAVTLICGRDADKLERARSEIRAAGADVKAYQVDLADMADCERFVQQLLGEHRCVDILINNAGRSIRRAVEASYDRFHDFERTMQLNYFGALRITMGLLPAMVARQSGHIINISSIGVLTYAPRFSAYVASKAALDAWTLCAASELADAGILFTTINMPLVRTPMIAPTQAYKEVPALSPEEAAEMVAQALVNKPLRLATHVGIAGQGLHLLAPELAQTVLNTAFRLFPEDGMVDGHPREATPELLAMQHLLRGVHL